MTEMNIAIYARVSTKEKGQEAENQIRQLKDYISKQSGWMFTAEFVDQASAKDTNRPEFKRMMDCASRREFDVLLFWSLDRLSREGTMKTHQLLEQLSGYGVLWKSFTEQYLDTCGIFKEVIISLLAVLAKQERLRLSERVHAGIDRYKEDMSSGRIGNTRSSKSGRNLPIGRQKRIFDRELALRLKNEGKSVRQIARQLGISNGTAWNAISGVQ